MNILIGQNHLHHIGGTEKYTYDLIKELKSRPDVKDIALIIPHSMYLGVMSEKIEKDLGVVTNKIDTQYIKGDKKFDMCLINHNTTMDRLLKSYINYDKKNIFQIIHGTTPGVEQPYLTDYFYDKEDLNLRYITISQEISDYIADKYQVEGIVINNGIDEGIFLNNDKINKKASTLFSLSQSNDFNEKLKVLCKELKLKFSCANKWENPKFDISQEIKKSDIVVSLGRGAYESMMAGKFVIVADERGYQGGKADGAITKENIDKMLYSNCSGRAFNFSPTLLYLKQEINKYNKKSCEFNRKYAKSNFSLKKQVDKILSLKI